MRNLLDALGGLDNLPSYIQLQMRRMMGQCMRTKVGIQSTSAMLKRWLERLEKRRMATESGGDETATRPGTRPAVPGTRPATRRRRRLVTNETTATGGIMYTDEGELEFDEDEMAALEWQRLFAEFRRGIY